MTEDMARSTMNKSTLSSNRWRNNPNGRTIDFSALHEKLLRRSICGTSTAEASSIIKFASIATISNQMNDEEYEMPDLKDANDQVSRQSI